IVYWDEDRLAFGHRRHSPWLKPDWSPRLLLSVNYLAHAFVRRSLVRSIAGASSSSSSEEEPGFSWDFALRASEAARRIEHLAGVLSHRRTIACVKREEVVAAIEGHLRRQGVPQPAVSVDGGGIVRAVWPTAKRLVSIIIPTKDKVAYLRACLTSIFTLTDYPAYEIVLVDTASPEAQTHPYYHA